MPTRGEITPTAYAPLFVIPSAARGRAALPGAPPPTIVRRRRVGLRLLLALQVLRQRRMITLLLLVQRCASADWAVVTGASSGIGEQLALQAAQRGYDVVLHGRRRRALHRLKKGHRSPDWQKHEDGRRGPQSPKRREAALRGLRWFRCAPVVRQRRRRAREAVHRRRCGSDARLERACEYRSLSALRKRHGSERRRPRRAHVVARGRPGPWMCGSRRLRRF